MDGRRLRRWFLCGGLLVTAVGCNRNNTYHDSFGLPKPGQTVGPIVPNSSGTLSKMTTLGGGAQPPGAGVSGLPVEMATAKPRKPGTGLSPEAETAMADTQVAAAFADPPPANRDELLDMARMRYQKALKEDPKHKASLLGMARLYVRLGDRDKAIEMYKKYLHHHPKDTEVVHEVALSHAQWKDWNGAVGWCELALKADPENRTFRKTMGFCQARAGQWDAAFATLLQVMPEPQARYSIARVMEHLNRPDASRQQLQLAIQADPSFSPAREMLAELDGVPMPGEQPVVPGQPDPNPVRQVDYQK
jgi:hypothetical protein